MSRKYNIQKLNILAKKCLDEKQQEKQIGSLPKVLD